MIFRHIVKACIVLIAAAVPGMAGGTAIAGSVSITGTGGSFNVTVVSVREARFDKVVRQRYDFSCGSAALATLLTYYYGQSTTEQEVFQDMFERGDQNKIRKEGFSLLDMKSYLERRSIRANGYRVGLDKLAENGIPAISLMNTHGYLHFVIVKGVDANGVLLADPALGNRVISRAEFDRDSNGILFVILDNTDIARTLFNDEAEWQVRTKAPMGSALMREGLGHFALTLPGLNEF